ncbi:hypothetical protein [Enterovibrio norvegicus]|uniref:hypothetical protein n=1 Tax=Enterovibrio norvegicus TaxID=188144 RepID=UPI000C84D120|nr:hypothetical protein [Enterovibrio norvegicus]PMN65653.1 hypothetical protein BCT27_09575 [Enterovibrio norvegicus]
MNYIIDVNEFWLYIGMSVFGALLAAHIFYKNFIANEQERLKIELSEEYEEQLNNLQNELDASNESNRLLNEHIEQLMSRNRDLSIEIEASNEQCLSLGSQIEHYKTRHQQIAFEVATVQKYYKDARIDTTITL